MMKAAFYDGQGKMELRNHPIPKVGEKDILLDVKATGICGSDLQMNVDKDAPDDIPAGHEVAGLIVDIGKAVNPALLGKRVAVEIIGQGRACTTCWYCRQGQFRSCMNMTAAEGGGFAEFMKRKAIGCYLVPDEISWQEAALIEPLAVSIHGLRRGDMKGGEVVAILGSGNIGLTAIAAARAMGAGKIIATARYEQQAVLAKQLGADAALPENSDDFQARISEATDGRGADVTIETVGGHQSATASQAVDITRNQGRIVMLGSFRRPFNFDFNKPLLKEQSFIFSSCYSVLNGRHDYELAIDMLSNKTIPVKNMVTHTYTLDEIQIGFETAYNKSSGAIKVQILQ